MYDFDKILKSRVFLLPENGQYMDFNVLLCRKSVFKVPGIAWTLFWRHTTYTTLKMTSIYVWFLKKSKISIFFHLKMVNIWILMFSCVENPVLRFLKLFEAFLTSYNATQHKRDVNLCMILRELLKYIKLYIV